MSNTYFILFFSFNSITRLKLVNPNPLQTPRVQSSITTDSWRPLLEGSHLHEKQEFLIENLTPALTDQKAKAQSSRERLKLFSKRN